ncbi:hypothetical protein BDF21DRAFT_422998 [Thamnidium elegans]|nr:hypothetical protein BDF21DRAFT_422998 [Thamnidium elegans]
MQLQYIYLIILLYYDRDLKFNKLKFRSNIKKQQTLSEISKRLITGSRKYDPTRHMVIQDSNKKWKQLSPGDGPK